MTGPGPLTGVVDVDVPAGLDGERVDRALALLGGVTRRVASELVAAGSVRVDDAVVTTRSRVLRRGQRLRAELRTAEPPRAAPDPGVELVVVHEDRDLLVVDKPAGLVVHHGAGHRGGTLVDGLLARFPDLADLPAAAGGDPERPGIVHRLDKGTSGLLVVARSARAYESLTRQLRDRTMTREYVALVRGIVEADAGLIDAPIGRSTRTPTRMAVTQRGREARTSYRVLRRSEVPVPLTLVTARLGTGRTHQVRVHFASIGHAVVGDDRYGQTPARPEGLRDALVPGRLFLHARHLELEHPDGGVRRWDSPLPLDLRTVLARTGPDPDVVD
jgi:23S rRNA pseudouridine1911/1915/1917 synthase